MIKWLVFEPLKTKYPTKSPKTSYISYNIKSAWTPDQQEEKYLKKQAFNSMSSITLDAYQKVYGREREQSGGETTPVKQWVGSSNTT